MKTWAVLPPFKPFRKIFEKVKPSLVFQPIYETFLEMSRSSNMAAMDEVRCDIISPTGAKVELQLCPSTLETLHANFHGTTKVHSINMGASSIQ